MNQHTKTLLITGASSGIGLQFVQWALQQGFQVSCLNRSENNTLHNMQSDNFYCRIGSVANNNDVKLWVANTLARFKKIDVVINNAGSMYYMDIVEANYRQMKEMIDTNCLGMVNLIEAIVPALIESAQPHWINISSDAGKVPFPGLAVYSGTKAFIEFTARAMRQELLQHNVKITNIQPGNVNTELHQKSTDKKAVKHYGTINSGQYLSPNDVVSAIQYALSTPHHVAINEILIEPLIESI